MNQIKDFLNLLDFIVGTFWSMTIVELIPVLSSGTVILNSFDNALKILFSLVGLIYLAFRLIHFIRMSKLNIEFRKQEIIEKERLNFYKKWGDEFNGPQKEEPLKK
jgi:hypothetical protein